MKRGFMIAYFNSDAAAGLEDTLALWGHHILHDRDTLGSDLSLRMSENKIANYADFLQVDQRHCSTDGSLLRPGAQSLACRAAIRIVRTAFGLTMSTTYFMFTPTEFTTSTVPPPPLLNLSTTSSSTFYNATMTASTSSTVITTTIKKSSTNNGGFEIHQFEMRGTRRTIRKCLSAESRKLCVRELMRKLELRQKWQEILLDYYVLLILIRADCKTTKIWRFIKSLCTPGRSSELEMKLIRGLDTTLLIPQERVRRCLTQQCSPFKCINLAGCEQQQTVTGP
ncbi:hypothetical protein B566_EDAN008441 [Ephemera danica]|nr:hypothetical protein B566_EDAN008441 [Ephemera danica]